MQKRQIVAKILPLCIGMNLYSSQHEKLLPAALPSSALPILKETTQKQHAHDPLIAKISKLVGDVGDAVHIIQEMENRLMTMVEELRSHNAQDIEAQKDQFEKTIDQLTTELARGVAHLADYSKAPANEEKINGKPNLENSNGNGLYSQWRTLLINSIATARIAEEEKAALLRIVGTLADPLEIDSPQFSALKNFLKKYDKFAVFCASLKKYNEEFFNHWKNQLIETLLPEQHELQTALPYITNFKILLKEPRYADELIAEQKTAIQAALRILEQAELYEQNLRIQRLIH